MLAGGIHLNEETENRSNGVNSFFVWITRVIGLIFLVVGVSFLWFFLLDSFSPEGWTPPLLILWGVPGTSTTLLCIVVITGGYRYAEKYRKSKKLVKYKTVSGLPELSFTLLYGFGGGYVFTLGILFFLYALSQFLKPAGLVHFALAFYLLPGMVLAAIGIVMYFRSYRYAIMFRSIIGRQRKT